MAARAARRERLKLSFGQVETILAELHEIAPHKRIAFAGRIKNLQKAGIRQRPASGRGKAASYGLDEVIALLIGLQLTQAGIPPSRAAEMVNASTTTILRGFAREAWEINCCNRMDIADPSGGWFDLVRPDDLVFSASCDAMLDLSDPDEDDAGFSNAIRLLSAKAISGPSSLFSYFQVSSSRWRTISMNCSQIARALFTTVCYKLKYMEFTDAGLNVVEYSTYSSKGARAHKLFKLDDPRFKALIGHEFGLMYAREIPELKEVPSDLWTFDETRRVAKYITEENIDLIKKYQASMLDGRGSKPIDPEDMTKLIDLGIVTYSTEYCWVTRLGDQIFFYNPTLIKAETGDVSSQA